MSTESRYYLCAYIILLYCNNIIIIIIIYKTENNNCTFVRTLFPSDLRGGHAILRRRPGDNVAVSETMPIVFFVLILQNSQWWKLHREEDCSCVHTRTLCIRVPTVFHSPSRKCVYCVQVSCMGEFITEIRKRTLPPTPLLHTHTYAHHRCV